MTRTFPEARHGERRWAHAPVPEVHSGSVNFCTKPRGRGPHSPGQQTRSGGTFRLCSLGRLLGIPISNEEPGDLQGEPRVPLCPPPEHGVTFTHGGRGAAVPYCAERNARNDRRPRGLPEAAPTGVGRVAEPPRCLHGSAGVPGRGEDELGCVPTATPRAPLAPKRY